MSLVTIPGSVTIGPDPVLAALTGNLNYIQDAAGETVVPAVIEWPDVALPLRTVGFPVSTVTTPGVDPHDIRIETVDPATGLNTGTLVGTNTNGSLVIGSTGFKTVTLTADASIAPGTKVALVCKAPPANFGNVRIGTLQDIPSVFPYPITVAAGKSSIIPAAMFQLSDGTVINVDTWPMSAFAGNSFASNSNPNRRGARFRVTAPTRFCGIDLWIDGDGDYDVVFYDADGVTATVLASVDKDIRAGTAVGCHRIRRFASYPSLLANTWYRVVVVPTTTTAVAITEMQFAAAAHLGGFPGGTNFQWTQVNGVPASEANWTNTDTSRLYAAWHFDQFHDGAAAGGGGGGTGYAAPRYV